MLCNSPKGEHCVSTNAECGDMSDSNLNVMANITMDSNVSQETVINSNSSKDVKSTNESSVWNSGSQSSISQQMEQQNDQFFIVPGLDDTLSQEDFLKITNSQSGYIECCREVEQGILVPQSHSNKDILNESDNNNRILSNEEEWRTLQDMKIKGLEEAAREKERQFHDERKLYHSTICRHEQTISTQSHEINRLENELDKMHQVLKEQTDDNHRLKTIHMELKSDLTKTEASLALKSRKIFELKEENEILADKLERLHHQDKNDIDEHRGNVDILRAEVTQCNEIITSIKEAMNREKSHTEQLQKDNRTVVEEKKQLKQKLYESQVKCESIERNLAKVQDASKHCQNESFHMRTKLEDKVAYLVRGIRALETDWKHKYTSLEQRCAQNEHKYVSDREQLEHQMASRQGVLEQKLAASNKLVAKYRHELDAQEKRCEELGDALNRCRRQDSVDQRQAAEQIAARDLALAQLRVQLERLQLRRQSAAAETNSWPSKPFTHSDQLHHQQQQLVDNDRLLKWQRVCMRLRAANRQLREENQQLQRQMTSFTSTIGTDTERNNKSTECCNSGQAAAPDADAVAKLEANNKLLLSQVLQLQKQLHQEQASANGFNNSSTALHQQQQQQLHIRQLMASNARLSETIMTQGRTLDLVRAELSRHRAAVVDTEFMRRQRQHLARLLVTEPSSPVFGATVTTTASSSNSDHHHQQQQQQEVRALQYKLRVAAQYICEAGRRHQTLCHRYRDLCRQLTAANCSCSAPALYQHQHQRTAYTNQSCRGHRQCSSDKQVERHCHNRQHHHQQQHNHCDKQQQQPCDTSRHRSCDNIPVLQQLQQHWHQPTQTPAGDGPSAADNCWWTPDSCHLSVSDWHLDEISAHHQADLNCSEPHLAMSGAVDPLDTPVTLPHTHTRPEQVTHSTAAVANQNVA